MIKQNAPPEEPKEDEILKRKMEGGFSTVGKKLSNTSKQIVEPQDNSNTITVNELLSNKNDYNGQGVAKISASRIKDRSLLLTQGSKIPCTLETALDSTVPGMTSCIIANDIYSADGKVRLIDRGSKLNGRYESDIKQGKARIAILWERLETPEGVLIALNSPSTDTLGRAGATGYIDKHFWERFGNAIMLSLVSDAFQYIDSRRTNNTDRFKDTEQSMKDMATIALENEINIAPTLHKNQGEPIMVFLNKDLSFFKC